MSGQMRKFNYVKYEESLKVTGEPIVPKGKVDLRGLKRIADQKGMPVSELSHKDKMKFTVFYPE